MTSIYLISLFMSLNEKEKKETEDLFKRLENKIQKLQNISMNEEQTKRKAQIFIEKRLYVSTTLRSNKKIKDWQTANSYMEGRLQEGASLNFDEIHKINSLLEVGAELRTGDIFSESGNMYCSSKYFKEGLKIFRHRIAEDKFANPLEKASLVRYWICSLHPFVNGNGRTANLATDWILLENGILPLSFPNVKDSLIAKYEGTPQGRTAFNAVLKTYEAIQYSYDLFGCS